MATTRTKKSAAPAPTTDAPVQTPTPPAAARNGNGSKKTPCPFASRAEFRQAAPPTISVVINGVPQAAMRHEFSTGSLGYSLNGPVTLDVGGRLVKFQCGLNLTIANSKELPPS